MIKAFVFGKFLPFHKGHEAMINFALNKCDHLSVLVCCSNQEKISGDTRRNWIAQSFIDDGRIEINVYDYDESVLPNTSIADYGVSKMWAAVFKKLYPEHKLLVSSEPYGKLVAGFMEIEHLLFDDLRSLHPVSATSIRNNLMEGWQFLPAATRKYFAIKVVLLGTESTGKTTLATQLATHFGCTCVPECGREMIAHSSDFSWGDLYKVAAAHAKNIEQAVTGESPLVIIDTDIHITQSYATFAFGQRLLVDETIHQASKADLYLYCCNDAPFVQDGTRLSLAERNKLDLSHRQILQADGIEIIEIKGNWKERFNRSAELINALLQEKRQIKVRLDTP